jgi:S-adenosylmethionine synthetase
VPKDVKVIAADARGEFPRVSVRAVADMELDGVPHAKDSVFYLDRNVARNLVAAKLVKRVTVGEELEAAVAPPKSTRKKR